MRELTLDRVDLTHSDSRQCRRRTAPAFFDDESTKPRMLKVDELMLQAFDLD
jgi:hypothetical protein